MDLIKRINNIIETQFIQHSMQKHFEKTEYEKQLQYFKGKYLGRRCF